MGADHETHPECDLCTTVATSPSETWILRTDHWSAMATPMFPQPGWVGLVANRHVQRLDELTADELANFGMVAADLERAITEVTGARKVYLWMFGDRAPHLHAVLAPKPGDPPAEHVGPGLAVHRADYADPERAAEVTAAMQRAVLGDRPNGEHQSA